MSCIAILRNVLLYTSPDIFLHQTSKRWISWKISWKLVVKAGQWWVTYLNTALGRQRQVALSELEAFLVHRPSSRKVTKATQKPCLELPTAKIEEKKN